MEVNRGSFLSVFLELISIDRLERSRISNKCLPPTRLHQIVGYMCVSLRVTPASVNFII